MSELELEQINGIKVNCTDYRRAESVRLATDEPELFHERSAEQIGSGLLSDGRLDPRGYAVVCHGCWRQWWGTPDNLPIGEDLHRADCPKAAAV